MGAPHLYSIRSSLLPKFKEIAFAIFELQQPNFYYCKNCLLYVIKIKYGAQKASTFSTNLKKIQWKLMKYDLFVYWQSVMLTGKMLQVESSATKFNMLLCGQYSYMYISSHPAESSATVYHKSPCRLQINHLWTVQLPHIQYVHYKSICRNFSREFSYNKSHCRDLSYITTTVL